MALDEWDPDPDESSRADADDQRDVRSSKHPLGFLSDAVNARNYRFEESYIS